MKSIFNYFRNHKRITAVAIVLYVTGVIIINCGGSYEAGKPSGKVEGASRGA